MRTSWILPLIPLLATAGEPMFLLHQIGNDRSEGITVFDFDRDGRLDVTSGAFWYKAPEWTRTEFRECKTSGEFVVNCGEFAVDVNGDGHTDILAAGWQEDGLFYFENPKQPAVIWPKVKIAPSRNTEGLIFVDVDGDGMKDLVPSHYSPQPVFWVQVKRDGFLKRPISPEGNGHGVGYGDIDGDGKKDMMLANGWHRQIDLAKDQWEYKPEFKLGLAGIAMYTYDFNQDGLPDILFGKGHDYGLFWLEQKKDRQGKRSWEQHVIDMSYSQIHNVQMVDLDGDGQPEILAGKRYRGHNEKDPGSFDPLAIYYYKFQPGKEPKFTRHTVAYNSPAGAGTQFVVIDLDADGDLDILCAGKTGQYWFENMTVNKVTWQNRDILFNRYPARQ